MSKDFFRQPEKNKATGYDYWYLAFLATVVLFTTAVRFRLLNVPLERDEGEHAYGGQLILQGIAPYTKVYNMVMPGIDVVYALIMAVFGQTCGGIRLGLLVVNVAAILLTFLLGKRLSNKFTGVAAATAFALLSLGQWVFGVFAHAEHFVIFFALGGILLLLRFGDCQKWPYLFGAALLLGLSFLMKQHAAVFILFAGLYLLYVELSVRPFVWGIFIARCVLFAAGVLLPFAATCLILWRLGVFEKFWLFTFHSNVGYLSVVTFSTGLNNLKDMMLPVLKSAPLIWILAAAGLPSLWWSGQNRQHKIFLTGFLVFSFLATCPGFYFREHYAIFLLPAAALLAGVGFTGFVNVFTRSKLILISKIAPVLLGVVVLCHTIYRQREFFFKMDAITVSRKTYEGNPFPESVEVAKFIREHSTKEDLIAVIGSEPQIYFYSQRRSATGYIYTYPLMEDQPYAVQMQKEMIREIEAARPKFLIFVNVNTSWLLKRDSEKTIFNWFSEYRRKYYQIVGMIDMPESGQTVYRWGSDATGYSPRSKSWFSVFQRKD
jgi:hypothetical protein